MKKQNPKTKSSTQEALDIAEIKKDVVVLKSSALRAIVETNSLNFALKSTKEQEATIYAYQSFLNSLDFPIQIVINSRELDVKDYLDMLKEKETQQANELLRIQIEEYIDFVRVLVEAANIMEKKFYIIVPFSSVEVKREGLIEKTKKMFKTVKSKKLSQQDFENYKRQLMQRVDLITTSLSGLGLQMKLLKTDEIINLFHGLYNPRGGTSHQ